MPNSSCSPEPTSKAPNFPPQKKRRRTQTNLTSASVTAPTPIFPSTSTTRYFKYEAPKHKSVSDDDIEKDYYNEENFEEEEAQAYGRESVGSVVGP